jgi:hypothetical protein
VKIDRDSGAPVNRVIRGPVEEVRERRSGESLIKIFTENPGRENPRGASGGGGAKPIVHRSEPSAGTKPRNRGLCGPVRRFGVGNNHRRNGRWVLSDGNVWIPGERSGFEGENPRSAAGAKQNRRGFEGRKPPGG